MSTTPFERFWVDIRTVFLKKRLAIFLKYLKIRLEHRHSVFDEFLGQIHNSVIFHKISPVKRLRKSENFAKLFS